MSIFTIANLTANCVARGLGASDEPAYFCRALTLGALIWMGISNALV